MEEGDAIIAGRFDQGGAEPAVQPRQRVGVQGDRLAGDQLGEVIRVTTLGRPGGSLGFDRDQQRDQSAQRQIEAGHRSDHGDRGADHRRLRGDPG